MPFSPSIVPSGEDQDVYLLLDQFGGRLGRAWRETDEADTDLETLIRRIHNTPAAWPAYDAAVKAADLANCRAIVASC